MFRQLAVAPIVGWKGVPEGMVTFVEEVGTTPLHQFEAVAQSMLVFPVQYPAVHPPVALIIPE